MLTDLEKFGSPSQIDVKKECIYHLKCRLERLSEESLFVKQNRGMLSVFCGKREIGSYVGGTNNSRMETFLKELTGFFSLEGIRANVDVVRNKKTKGWDVVIKPLPSLEDLKPIKNAHLLLHTLGD